MGTDGSEVRVTLALGLCQAGRAEEALAVLLDVRPDMPYGTAVHAIAAALTGDFVSPLDDADAVWADDGSTYLDRIYVDDRRGGRRVPHRRPRCRRRAPPRAGPARSCRRAGDGDRAFARRPRVGRVARRLRRRGFEPVEAGWRCVIDGLAEVADLTSRTTIICRELDAAARDRAGPVGAGRARGEAVNAPTGLIVGRFDPPHLGHSYMIDCGGRPVRRAGGVRQQFAGP